MLLGLATALVLAPVYWLLVPTRWRRESLSLASLAALAAYDPRLPLLLLAISAGLFGLLRAIGGGRAERWPLAAAGLTALLGLFVANKLAGRGGGALPTQGGLIFFGVSFLVLKAAGALIDAARGTLRTFPFGEIVAWLVFLPTYPSGPMEQFEHFRRQQPTWHRARVLGGLERILFGLVKALVCAHYLGVWLDPIVAAPAGHPPVVLLLGLFASAFRFYFDLAGYSDIAIGLAAVYGYEIQENFAYPFAARNLVLLWQRWHITLTGWLRAYVFTPLTRALMRRLPPTGDRLAIGVGQVATMLAIGLWHGVSWNFVAFGVLQGVGVMWVSLGARTVGQRLFRPTVLHWWRKSRLAHAIATSVTVTYFAATTLLVMTGVRPALHYARALVGG